MERVAMASRRNFLTWVWAGLIGLVTFESVWVVASFLKPRAKQDESGAGDSIVVAGTVDEFDPESVTAFPRGKFYLVRLADGGFLAVHRECTHLGCTVPWVEEEHRFACPCHASTFDITGEVLSAPAPRALDLFAVRIENGIVKVDTRRPIQRSAFRPEQVARV